MGKRLMVTTFRNVLLAATYIFGVSQFLVFGEKLFQGAINQNYAPFVFLLLFVLSAAVVGSLVFGQSVALFFENKKAESMKSAAYSVLWLFVITATAIITMLIAS
jgi:hypothetical protein